MGKSQGWCESFIYQSIALFIFFYFSSPSTLGVDNFPLPPPPSFSRQSADSLGCRRCSRSLVTQPCFFWSFDYKRLRFFFFLARLQHRFKPKLPSLSLLTVDDMSLRIGAKRASASLKLSACGQLAARSARRSYASPAAGSSLPEAVKASIEVRPSSGVQCPPFPPLL